MAALLLLALAAPLGVMAQASGCLQLTGSTMCPSFTDQYMYAPTRARRSLTSQ